MSVTLYSFLMALLCSSAFVVLLVLFRRKNEFIYTFGTTSMLLLFAGFVIRLALPVEFPFVKEIGLFDGLYANVNSFLMKNLYYGISFIEILVVIWGIVSAILLIKLVVKHIGFTRAMLRLKNHITPQITECQKRIEAELHVKNVHIICSPHFEAPLCSGIMKLILLPEMDYSDEDLYYILKHEYTHLKNGDLYLKMLVEVFVAIFWWNPFVYLLRYNLSDVLEIKCDLSVVGKENREIKASYLQTILNMVKASLNNDKKDKKLRLTTAEFVNYSKEDSLTQRFKVVINYKPNRRKGILYFTGFIATMVLTLSVSYMFVLQPAHTVPQEEIDEGGAVEITPENTYILETEDGKYILISDNGIENEIDESFKDMLILDGFEIKEE
ncbi:MAG: M56 family metallopeptidase [Ruminococcaceae bacterium]|nr:M56 family metallopeptidase [Oscillospiraceae bacterium]